MKLITALIQPYKLDDVKQALVDIGVAKLTVTNALGCGQQSGYAESYRGAKEEIQLLKKVRIEIAVNDDFVDKTVDAIIKGARTNNGQGSIGDGKIFVTDLYKCIRIRTGEIGKDAIG